jgi:hypothetical protein
MFKTHPYKMLSNQQNQALLLGGANTVGIAALAAYTVRTLNEMNASLEDMRYEMEQIRTTFSENNKRSNVAFNRLNQRIEENIQNVHTQSGMINGFKKQVKKMKLSGDTGARRIEELEESEEEEIVMPVRRNAERVDEITSAISDLMA